VPLSKLYGVCSDDGCIKNAPHDEEGDGDIVERQISEERELVMFSNNQNPISPFDLLTLLAAIVALSVTIAAVWWAFFR
jgi:hypothetical protein